MFNNLTCDEHGWDMLFALLLFDSHSNWNWIFVCGLSLVASCEHMIQILLKIYSDNIAFVVLQLTCKL